MNRILALNKTKRVVVGMSGGIDSAVTAYLLKLQGYQVLGLHMVNWDHKEEEEEHDDAATHPTDPHAPPSTGSLPAPSDCFEKDYTDVQQVCRALEMPCHQVNFVKEYWHEVFAPTLHGYDTGVTPNPDILCNRHIKFDLFLNHAVARLKADYIATGHYARLQEPTSSPAAAMAAAALPVQLLAGKDQNKDQSYFLSGVQSSQLSNVLFPLGNLTKRQVRNIARVSNIEILQRINQKKESYGMCFVGKRKFDRFIHQYLPNMPGPFIDVDTGEVRGFPLTIVHSLFPTFATFVVLFVQRHFVPLHRWTCPDPFFCSSRLLLGMWHRWFGPTTPGLRRTP